MTMKQHWKHKSRQRGQNFQIFKRPFLRNGGPYIFMYYVSIKLVFQYRTNKCILSDAFIYNI